MRYWVENRKQFTSAKKPRIVFPSIIGVQWESKSDRPGWCAWYAPEGNQAPRNTKTYLGYVGKKLLAEWLAMPPDERRAMVEGWINERHAEKGIG